MITNRPSMKTFLLIVLITASAFILWLSLLLLLWWSLRSFGFPYDLWAIIESLSTALAAAAVFTAGFIAYRELSEISNSRYMEVVERLLEELNSIENIEARRWIFQHLPADPQEGIDSMPPEGRAAIKRVLNSLDRVAFLTQSGWSDEDLVMPWMNPMIVKSWVKLKPYVEHERKRRHEPDYYQSASRLAERCVAWREKNVPNAEITWVEDALKV
jgi:hypothetical protein